MTLKEKFKEIIFNYDYTPNTMKQSSIQCEQVAEDFAIGFAEWKDDNFLMYKDGGYYAKTSSTYFDLTKYIGKEKSTKYYLLKELLEIYKKEKGL